LVDLWDVWIGDIDMKRATGGWVVCLTILVLVMGIGLLSGCNEDDVERSIGKQTAASVEKEYGVNNDPVLQEWANTLGHRLVGQSGRQNISYSFKVVNTDMVNAFAAPWGYVYMTEGFLDFAQSEDEVAFVLGHEVGHVANRDSIKSFKKSILYNIGSALLGGQSELLGNLGGLGGSLLLLHYSRDDERDADVAGSTWAYAAGYDPEGGQEFFKRLASELEKDKPSSLEHLLLTHPPTENRLNAVKARPEQNLSDPAVASHIGRTYARRYAFATASSFYKQALEKKPEAVETRLTLGEAYARQGLYDLARAEYEAVLQREPDNSFAETGLQAMAAPAPRARPATPTDVRIAATALPTVTIADQDTATLLETGRVYAVNSAGDIRANSAMAKGTISSLMEVSSQNKELSDRGNQIFLLANAAVSGANDSAFTMESMNGDLKNVADMLRENALTLKVAMQQAAAGNCEAGDAAIYRRAMMETRYGEKQIGRTFGEAQETTGEVQKATRAAQTTVEAMATMVNSKAPDKYIFPVRAAAEETKKKADEARAGVNKVKRMTAMAESRALLAKLNLMALGASPGIRRVYDGMVAYYCNATPAQVSELRAQGMGFGDAAFVLMAAHSKRAPASSYAGIVNDNKVIEGLRDQGFNFQGPVALLKFLDKAMEREAQAREGK
jgi:predicted Zn-dependent protease